MTTQSDWSFEPERIGERILWAMWRAKPRKLTPPKLAARVGVTDQTVRNWIDGKSNPNHGEILSIAVACGVPVEVLDPTHPESGIRWHYEAAGPSGDRPGQPVVSGLPTPPEDGSATGGYLNAVAEAA